MSKLPTLTINGTAKAEINRPASNHAPASTLTLDGGATAQIIDIYTRLCEHEPTGDHDASLFVWGVIKGLEHAAALRFEDVSAEEIAAETVRIRAGKRAGGLQ